MPTDDEQGDRMLMDKRIQLRQKSDGSPEDERLAELIIAAWDAPKGTFKHKRAFHNLIESVQAILKGFKFWKNFNQEAEVGFNHIDKRVKYEPLVYLSQNIDDFIPTGTTIKNSLTGWLRAKAVNRLIDIDRQEQGQQQKLKKQFKYINSIDAPVKAKNKDGESETVEPSVPDPSLSPTILDGIISQLDRKFMDAFVEYLKTDPEGNLKKCAMKPPQDHCNCFTLVELLYFHQPPLNQTEAAKVLGLNSHDGLRSHWKRQCLPLLKQIAEETAQDNGWEID